MLDSYLASIVRDLSVNGDMDRILSDEVEAKLAEIRDAGLLGLSGRLLRAVCLSLYGRS